MTSEVPSSCDIPSCLHWVAQGVLGLLWESCNSRGHAVEGLPTSASHPKLLLRPPGPRERKVPRTLSSHRRLPQLEANPSEQRREWGLPTTEAPLSPGQLLLEQSCS